MTSGGLMSRGIASLIHYSALCSDVISENTAEKPSAVLVRSVIADGASSSWIFALENVSVEHKAAKKKKAAAREKRIICVRI